MPKIFSSFLSSFNVISKKKKGHHADGGIFFSDFMLISKKKKGLSSPTFLHDFCDIPEQNAVNRGCLQFLAGNKNAGFWREKKRRNSQNFSTKMPEKISHFFGGGVVTKIGANFDWQFQLPMEVGVLTTANFVGSWHCQFRLVPILVSTPIAFLRL